MKEREMAERNLIFKCINGSMLYGTDTPSSDKDYVGIFVPDKDYVLGVKTCEQVDIKTNPSDSGHRNTNEDVDTTYYSLPKFIHLAFQNNPNIVELFFVPEQHTLFKNEFGKRLMDAFPLFVSKRCKDRFLGYAISQKHKVLNKNPIGNRKQYVEKYGYDVKFASHIIRLLDEGIQLLTTGTIRFPLYIAGAIKKIKEGGYKLEDVLQDANSFEQRIEQCYQNSRLPQTGDIEAINKLQISLLEDFWDDQAKWSK